MPTCRNRRSNSSYTMYVYICSYYSFEILPKTNLIKKGHTINTILICECHGRYCLKRKKHCSLLHTDFACWQFRFISIELYCTIEWIGRVNLAETYIKRKGWIVCLRCIEVQGAIKNPFQMFKTASVVRKKNSFNDATKWYIPYI